MFDQHAREIIDELPRLPQLDPTACRRALSLAYLLVVDGRLQVESDPALVGDSAALREELRRMATALESVAVFDALHGLDVAAATRQASAFVAAEALFLLSELAVSSVESNTVADPVRDATTYALLESSLLYMIAGYDVNAVATASRISKPAPPGEETSFFRRRRTNGVRLTQQIKALCRGEIRRPLRGAPLSADVETPVLLSDIEDDTRARLYEVLTGGLEHYLAWLRGDSDSGLEEALSDIERVRSACSSTVPTPILEAFPFADVAHLAALIRAAIDMTKDRSVVHGVPSPSDGDVSIRERFPKYLRVRASGPKNSRGRPFLWPSTLEYVRDALPGPHKDAVISMPTGSGKSFLAELAIAHALARGWVVYLAPTNALAHQIRRDLADALRSFDKVQVAAFIGGAEYTALADESVTTDLTVVVMTPEKCALALRLYPETFAQCSLCVFDECHLLNDQNRGIVADVLMAQLFRMAPNMRVLLMSAMISNADELAAWLQSVRGSDAKASQIKWRPSRTARGFVFVDELAEEASSAQAKERLDATVGAKTISYEVPLAWITGLSGPWTRDGADDFRTARLPITATKQWKRTKKKQVSHDFASWKNGTGQRLAELLASHGIPTINFLLSSRHHAFSRAEAVKDAVSDAVGDGPLPDVVEAQLAVADAELGVTTALRGLLRKGIAVHTSAMLQVEQAASEYMFVNGKATLMFATGTLAQGLNLPAVAVVVSGSQLGNPQDFREVDAAAGIDRANALILNGFGRASRPGFSNQGFVVLVSDKAFSASVAYGLDGAEVIDVYPVLAQPDAAVEVRSPIERFLDLLISDPNRTDTTELQVALTSLLAAFDDEEENAGKILRRTFAGYRRRNSFTLRRATFATKRIAELKARFLETGDVPEWMPKAAMKAGVEFFHAQRLWEAYAARGVVFPDEMTGLDVLGWFDVLIDVLSYLPVNRVMGYLDPAKTETPRTRLAKFAAKVRSLDTVPWNSPKGWNTAWQDLGNVVRCYMEGRPFTEIGAALYGCSPSEVTSGRSGGRIPGIFKFIGEVVDRALTLDAGCFLALHECWFEAEYPDISIPEPLQALPLCIRNGCPDLDVLAWFRFGFRQRMCAHALAQAFPIPEHVTDDAARKTFVSRARNAWLQDEDKDEDEDPLLGHARILIREGSSERT